MTNATPQPDVIVSLFVE